MKRKTPEARFFEGFEVVTETGCWIWMGYLNSGGYGYIHNPGGVKQAHRFSWVLHNGSIPEGLWVLHRCDVRACCNPGHLFLGTPKDNIYDAMRKGRSRYAYGERGGLAKLTNEDVRAVRTLYAEGSTQKQIANQFGLSISGISSIVRGRTWSHLT